MSFNFFGFGRKKTRRTVRKTRKSVRKTAKPAKSLIKLCKKYGVKVTKKSGSKRVYKKTAVLKKQCAKKIRSIIKRRKSVRKTTRRRTARFGARSAAPRRVAPRSVASSMMVTGVSKPMASRSQRIMAHFRRNSGKYAGATAAAAAAAAGRYAHAEYKGRGGFRRLSGDAMTFKPGMKGEGSQMIRPGSGLDLMKADLLRAKHVTVGAKSIPAFEANMYRQQAMASPSAAIQSKYAKGLGGLSDAAARARAKTAAKAAEKAAAMFGKRRRGVRRYRFGSGGNPSLSSSMGYEFCSNGGGVLGANSTGLFPSPCMGATMPMMGAGPAAAFGKRRRRRM